MTQWTQKELRCFWGLARKVADQIGIDPKEMVYDTIGFRFGKDSLKELTRKEFIELMTEYGNKIGTKPRKNMMNMREDQANLPLLPR